MQCTGAQALIRALGEEGVEVVFGYPGGAILPVYDALVASSLRHVLTRHEQGAIHAAEGYAKASGKVGVVIATSGPGATNLVTGLLDALLDSIPLVAITGQVARPVIGTDAFQEADVLGITMPAVKHNYLVKDPSDLLPTIREAFHLARSGRPGPVLVDIPKDVAAAKVSYHYPPSLAHHLTHARPLPAPSQLEAAVDCLLAAKQPVIVCGGGCVTSNGAPQRLTELAELIHAPVACTLQGLGGIPGQHPLAVGMLGMHGLYAANMAVQEADVMLAVGMRFDDRVTGKLDLFAPKARVIHIDVDPAEIGKNVRPLIGLLGDAGAVLTALLATVKSRTGLPLNHDGWIERIRTWHREHPTWVERRRSFRVPVVGPNPALQAAAAAMESDTAVRVPIRTEDVLRAVQVAFGPEAIVTTDVGQHQMWAAHFCLRSEPRTFLTSGGLGTMGFSLPAGMGAQLARPDRQVVVLAGDGGFQMTLQELGTVIAEKLPLRIMVINNGYLGMVRQWQQLFYERRYSGVNLQIGMPDLVKLAEAYGMRGIRVESKEHLPWAVQEAKAHDGPILVEFRVVEEENVYPMVVPGAANDSMVFGDPVKKSIGE